MLAARPLLLVLLVSLVAPVTACGHDTDARAEPPPVPAPKAKPARPDRPKDAMQTQPLGWTLTTSPDKKLLLVDIEFHNTTGQKIYLADQAVVSAGGNKLKRSNRITVMNSDDPTVARFVLGVTSSDRPSTMLYEPTYELVEPNATVKRHFEVPLPLSSWHPVGGANPLSEKTTSAKLIVQGFFGEPARWTTVPTDDPQPIRSPELTQDRQVYTAGPVPLPR